MAIADPLEWQLEDYLRIFRLYKWRIGLITLLLGGFMAFYMAQQPDIYKATTRILIEPQAARVVQFEEVSP
ncbi:MAG: hypothetical protein HYZ93_05770, partial [Candidatus Omnitrophica bacterium]|nr:hypothetical protein [Candidatus Omnitrophota bacterium]